MQTASVMSDPAYIGGAHAKDTPWRYDGVRPSLGTQANPALAKAAILF